MVNHKYKFIFVHINRTGGTSWERAFGMRSGHDHRTVHALTKLKVWDHYFKFTFVRNPWDRYVSIYRNRKIRTPFGNWIGNLVKHHKLPISVSNQVNWISKNGKIFVDYVARFENYAAEWNKICEILGVKKRVFHKNATKHRHYRDFYNNESRENVRILAAKDIAEFGYDF
jgi:hypothetical protein